MPSQIFEQENQKHSFHTNTRILIGEIFWNKHEQNNYRIDYLVLGEVCSFFSYINRHISE